MERKEAIEIVKSEQFSNELLREALETLIPELQNEDERIRKTIIRIFTKDTSEQYYGFTSKQIIAWLEKQGNDNSISGRNIAISLIKYLDDNRYEGAMNMSSVECEDLEKAILDSDWGKVYRYMQKKLEKQGNSAPDTIKEKRDFFKFHEGEWIVSNDKKEAFLIKSISCGYASLEDTEGVTYSPCLLSDDAFHHWTIEDAEDGDVLAFYYEHKGNKMEQVGIIKKYVGRHGGCSNSFNIHVGLSWENNLQIGEYMGCNDIQPATKEQRDILFSKIKEAGYEWDDDAKTFKIIDWSKHIKCNYDNQNLTE